MKMYDMNQFQKWAEAEFAKYHMHFKSMEMTTQLVTLEDGETLAILPGLKIIAKTDEEIIQEVTSRSGTVLVTAPTVSKSEE